MKYFLKTTIGLGLVVASLVGISYGVYQLLQIGTCASGGPYEIARECPTGTERLGLVIPGALIVTLVGGVIYGTRGAAPGSERPADGGYAFAFWWAGLFLGIAFACFWGVWGPDANPGPGGKLGGLIVGFTFVPLGVLGAIPMLSAAKAARAAKEATGVGVGDAIKFAREARKADFSELVGKIQGRSPATPPATGDTGAVVAELERLQKLREQGAIDDAEFERLKARVMRS